MWKKDEASETSPEVQRTERTPSPRNDAPPSGATRGETATIGRSITIRGEVTGDEDLLIQGKVDGSVDLEQHSVTVGPEGQVKAGIKGRTVTVEGTVEGDLHAQEQVILRSTARVEGDITSPRVVLEDGATFRGGVDMGDRTPEDQRSQKGSSSSTSDRSTRSATSTSGSRSSLASTTSGDGSKGDSDDSKSSSTKDRKEKATGATT